MQSPYLFRFECCGFGAYGPVEDISRAISSLKHVHRQHINYKKCAKKPTIMVVLHVKKEIEIDINTLDPDYQETIYEYTEAALQGSRQS